MQWARGLTVTTTGLDKHEKDAIRQDVEHAEGRYSPNLSKRTTHLVTPEMVGSVTQKLAAAAGAGPGQQQRFKALQVVSQGWVSASAGLRARADETQFAPLLPPPGTSACSAELSFGSGSAAQSAQHAAAGAGQNAGPQTPWVVHFSQMPDDSVYRVQLQQQQASPSAAHQLAQQLHLLLSPIAEAYSPAQTTPACQHNASTPGHADPAAGQGLGGTWQLQQAHGAPSTTPDRLWQHQEQQQQLYRTPSGHMTRCEMPPAGEGPWGTSLPGEAAASHLSPRLHMRPPALHLLAGGNSGSGGGGPAAAGSLDQQQAGWQQQHIQQEQLQHPQQQEQQHAEACAVPAAAAGDSNVGDLIAALRRATGDSRRGTTGSSHPNDAAAAVAVGGAGAVASSGSTPSRCSLAGRELSAGCLPMVMGDGSINSSGGSSIETLLQSLKRLSDRTAAAAAAASGEVSAAAPAATTAAAAAGGSGPVGASPTPAALPGVQQQRLSLGSGFAAQDLDCGLGECFQQQQQHAAGALFWGSGGGYGSSGLGSGATTAGGAAEYRGLGDGGGGGGGVSAAVRGPSPLDLDRLLGRLHSAAHADSGRGAACVGVDGGGAVPGGGYSSGSSRALAYGGGSGGRAIAGEAGRPPWEAVSGTDDSRQGTAEAVAASPRGLCTDPASIGQLLGLLRRATADSRRGTAEGLAGADGNAAGDAVLARATANSSRRTTGEVGPGPSGSRPQDIEQLLGLLHRVTADSRRGTAESLQGAPNSSGLAQPVAMMGPGAVGVGGQAVAEAAAVPLPLSQSTGGADSAGSGQAATAAHPAEVQARQASIGMEHAWGSGLGTAAQEDVNNQQLQQQLQDSLFNADGGSHGSSSVAELIAALRRATGESRRNTSDVLAAAATAAAAAAAAGTDTAAGSVDARPGRRDAGRGQKPHLTVKLPSDHDSKTTDAAAVPLSQEAHACSDRSDAGSSCSSSGEGQQHPLEQGEDGDGSIVGLVSALQCIAAASKLQEAAAIAPEVAAITQCHAAAVQHQADLMQGSQYAELVGRLSLELSQLNEKGLHSMQKQHEQQQQQQQQHCGSGTVGLDAAVDRRSGPGVVAAAAVETASAVGTEPGGDGGAADALSASMSSGSQGLQRLVAALRRVTAEAAEAGCMACTPPADASAAPPPAPGLLSAPLQPHPWVHTEGARGGLQATIEEGRNSGLDALLSALQASSAPDTGKPTAVAEAAAAPLPTSQHTAGAGDGSGGSGCSQPPPAGWAGEDSSGRKVRDLVAALERATAGSGSSSGRHWQEATHPGTDSHLVLPGSGDSGSVEQLLQQLALSAAKLQPPEPACPDSNAVRAPTSTAAELLRPAAAAAAAAAGGPLPAEDSGLLPPQGLLQTPEPAPDAQVSPPRSCHARRPSAGAHARSNTPSPLPPAAAAAGHFRLGGSVSPSPPSQGLAAAAQAAAAEALGTTGSQVQAGVAESACSTDGPVDSSPGHAGARGERGTSRSPTRLLAGGVQVQSAAGHLFLSVPEGDDNRPTDGPAKQVLAEANPGVCDRPASRAQEQLQQLDLLEPPGGLCSPPKQTQNHHQQQQQQQQQVLAVSTESVGTRSPAGRQQQQQQQQPGTNTTAAGGSSVGVQQLPAGLDWSSLVVAFDRLMPAAMRQQLSEQLTAVGAAVVSGTPHLGCGANVVVAEPEAAAGLLSLLLDIVTPTWLAKALKHHQQQQQQQQTAEPPQACQAGSLPAAQRLVRVSPDVVRAISLLLQQPGNSSSAASAAVSRQGSGGLLSAGKAGLGTTEQQLQVTGAAGDADKRGSSPGSSGSGYRMGRWQQPPVPVLVLPRGYTATSAGSNMPVLLQEVQSDCQQQQQVMMPATLLTDQLWSVGQHPRMVAEEELEAVVLLGSLCATLTLLLPQSSSSLLGHAAVTCCPADAGKGLTCGDVLAAVHLFYQQEVLLLPDHSCEVDDHCQGGAASGTTTCEGAGSGLAGTQRVKRLQLLGHKQMFEGLFRATKDPCSSVYEVCLA